MAYKLPVDCLNEIFEYLEMDKFTLHSCLLVNRLWCEVSVRILWRNILDFNNGNKRSIKIKSSILSTLIACLPNESKKLLHDNNIFISIPTSKPLLFKYASFCKSLSIYWFNRIIIGALGSRKSFNPKSKYRNSLVASEIIKMLANQIFSLKHLTYHNRDFYKHKVNISFPNFPGARNLSELYCDSDLPSDFFYQLSQICHNLQSISIDFQKIITNELKELISSQNNLKELILTAYGGSWTDIIPTITKYSNTITILSLYNYTDTPFSFVSSFSNLQELVISFLNGKLEDLKKLQYVKFPKLQILKIPYYHDCIKPEYIVNFIEINGKNLKKLYIGECIKALNLSIAKFCPNLKSLFIIFKNGEPDVLKTILISCQYLESIKTLCGKYHSSEKEVLETIAKYSPNNFCELKIQRTTNSNVFPNDLESFFINWERRTPKKLLSFIIIDYKEYGNCCEEEVIKKYVDLGTIKFVSNKSVEEEREEEEEYYRHSLLC
ncbi:hypothetical protein RhiirB3_444681 [Rhizophagus irregularis]|nr:hypothetical protein RhiirB3_444681 [Rhizophagus irregularis]